MAGGLGSVTYQGASGLPLTSYMGRPGLLAEEVGALSPGRYRDSAMQISTGRVVS